MEHRFELPANYKKWTWGLIIAGLLALLYGVIMFHPFAHAGHGENTNSTRFWAVLLQNLQLWQWAAGKLHFAGCRKLFQA